MIVVFEAMDPAPFGAVTLRDRFASSSGAGSKSSAEKDVLNARWTPEQRPPKPAIQHSPKCNGVIHKGYWIQNPLFFYILVSTSRFEPVGRITFFSETAAVGPDPDLLRC